MSNWRIVSGSRSFHQFPGRDVSIGWARDLERDGVQRTVNVCVATGADEAPDLPDECRAAIRSHGRTVINAILDEEGDPPRIIDVTTTGLEYEYGGYEEDLDEEEDADGDEDADDGGEEAAADQDAAVID